jgi:hypothetical protein
MISGIPTKERVPVIVATSSSILNFDSSKITTTTTLGTGVSSVEIVKDVRASIRSPSCLENTCSNRLTRSPDRPPRSIEQPLAKSAFSRPKQYKSIHCYENETSNHDVLIPRPCIQSSTEIPLFRDRQVWKDIKLDCNSVSYIF